METWQRVFRVGMCPHLPTTGLHALLTALRTDDPELAQNVITTPTCKDVFLDEPVEAACAIAYIGWRGLDIDTVGQVEGFYAAVCEAADVRLKEPGISRFFINAYDEWPRDIMRLTLTAEVERELAQRAVAA